MNEDLKARVQQWLFDPQFVSYAMLYGPEAAMAKWEARHAEGCDCDECWEEDDE